eukprot:518652_1
MRDIDNLTYALESNEIITMYKNNDLNKLCDTLDTFINEVLSQSQNVCGLRDILTKKSKTMTITQKRNKNKTKSKIPIPSKNRQQKIHETKLKKNIKRKEKKK